jgi:hypothetical protein
VALLYVLAAPVFSAFRLELTFVPAAAWGLGLLAVVAGSHLRESDRLSGLRIPQVADRLRRPLT